MMHTATASSIHPFYGYPPFSSHVHNHHHYLSDPTHINTSSLSHSTYPTGLSLSSSYSNTIRPLSSDDENENHQLQSASLDESTSSSSGPVKRRARLVPSEDKDTIYYEKRTRNNQSAKRSRDTRRIKEQQIEERVSLLEHENTRLAMENQTIRYQLSQLHLLRHGVSKASQ